MLEIVLVLFFLLISGDTFLRRSVEILPRFKNKRQVVDIWKQIESDISAYLVTITFMNAAVGAATGTVVVLVGLGDPVLWGRLGTPPGCCNGFFGRRVEFSTLSSVGVGCTENADSWE
jgi:predicted PurR-regulated permease PerM